MGFGGAALKIGQTSLRVIQLLASIVALAIYSYYLAVLASNDVHIAAWKKGVEGIAGAAVLYGIFCVFLTLCLGGIMFFAFLAVVLDVLFVGGFVAIAWYNRGGTQTCTGYVNTPLGDGDSSTRGSSITTTTTSGNAVVYYPDLHRACVLEKVVFAVAIINIILFIITALMQLALAKHHKREKRFGPGPNNGYTGGSGRQPFWKRRRNRNTATAGVVGGTAVRDPEMGTTNAGVRPSGDTTYTGATATHPEAEGHGKFNAHTQY